MDDIFIVGADAKATQEPLDVLASAFAQLGVELEPGKCATFSSASTSPQKVLGIILAGPIGPAAEAKKASLDVFIDNIIALELPPLQAVTLLKVSGSVKLHYHAALYPKGTEFDNVFKHYAARLLEAMQVTLRCETLTWEDIVRIDTFGIENIGADHAAHYERTVLQLSDREPPETERPKSNTPLGQSKSGSHAADWMFVHGSVETLSPSQELIALQLRAGKRVLPTQWLCECGKQFTDAEAQFLHITVCQRARVTKTHRHESVAAAFSRILDRYNVHHEREPTRYPYADLRAKRPDCAPNCRGASILAKA
jgi:hypothetical protein